ncbi:MAG: type I restriction endonuclease [Thermoguttaceae bacterium]
MFPEQQARIQIDEKLKTSGWRVQNREDFNPKASLGVAVADYPTSTGPADYVLCVAGVPVGVIEAKKRESGESITTVEKQSSRYANSTIKYAKADTAIPSSTKPPTR